MRTIERWGLYEVGFRGPCTGNPFREVAFSAQFRQGGHAVDVEGFYDGGGLFVVRFMPDREGDWTVVTRSNVAELDGHKTVFVCVPCAEGRGPVVVEGLHFRFREGPRYHPFGTTCYAWLHQSEERQRETLETLSAGPFNKLRMTLFPKSYEYNRQDPADFVFPREGDSFDFTRFDTGFFHRVEQRILDLQKLGIEADLILFHPYDRWGFSELGRSVDEFYLRYVLARLAAFRNVWWSLANEYDVFFRADGTPSKHVGDWEHYGRFIEGHDPSQHLRSIHNCLVIYDQSQSWITHCSLQRVDHMKTAENTTSWIATYQKPVVIDECGYEGNLHHGWGNLSGQEMVRRFWEGFVRGGAVGHGETYLHPQDILWWSHGGHLHGSSPARIAFLRGIMEDTPGPLSPIPKPEGALFDPHWDVTLGAFGQDYYLHYFGFCQPALRRFALPEEHRYHIDVIDTWEMTITPREGTSSGAIEIELPGKPFIAVRIRRVT